MLYCRNVSLVKAKAVSFRTSINPVLNLPTSRLSLSSYWNSLFRHLILVIYALQFLLSSSSWISIPPYVVYSASSFSHYVWIRIFSAAPVLYLSAWNFAWWFDLIWAGFLPFWGDSPTDGRVVGVNRGHMAGYACCCWSTWVLVDLISSVILYIILLY